MSRSVVGEVSFHRFLWCVGISIGQAIGHKSPKKVGKTRAAWNLWFSDRMCCLFIYFTHTKSYGKSHSLIGKSTINLLFSIAMLVITRGYEFHGQISAVYPIFPGFFERSWHISTAFSGSVQLLTHPNAKPSDFLCRTTRVWNYRAIHRAAPGTRWWPPD